MKKERNCFTFNSALLSKRHMIFSFKWGKDGASRAVGGGNF